MSPDDLNANILAAEGVHKYFGRGNAKVHALRGADLTVRRGEFLAVMGPSGCGKSTLLHVLGFMTEPSAGRVIYNGEGSQYSPATKMQLRRRSIGFVFQRFNLLGMLNAEDNIALSLKIRGLPSRQRADELLSELGLADLAEKKPSQMSMGQQQRLAVARALAHEPELILADEPTGNLDSDNADILLGLLRRINAERGQTIVMITHSADAADRADRIVHMKDGMILESTG